MPNEYLKKASDFLKRLGIEIRNTEDPDEIKRTKSYVATLKPSKNRIVIK